MAYPNLDHANHVGLTFARVGDELRGTVTVPPGEPGVGLPPGGTTGQIPKKVSGADYDVEWAAELAATLEAVAGGAGFTPVSGAVTLDILGANARWFQHEMVGNITSLAFTNVPDANAFAAGWTWVLRINGIGGYALAGAPTVTFVDGGTWADLDLTANAVNAITFWRVGATTYAAFLTTGSLALDARELCFLTNGAIEVPILRAESLDVANAITAGSGVLTYKKNGSVISTRTSFAAADVLRVECAAATGITSVAIPRYAA